jgi:hypothetical protein
VIAARKVIGVIFFGLITAFYRQEDRKPIDKKANF